MARSPVDHRLVVHQATGAAAAGVGRTLAGRACRSAAAAGPAPARAPGATTRAATCRRASLRSCATVSASSHSTTAPKDRPEGVSIATTTASTTPAMPRRLAATWARFTTRFSRVRIASSSRPGQHQVPIRSEPSEVLRRPPPVHVSWALDVRAEIRSRPSAMDCEPRSARSHPARRAGRDGRRCGSRRGGADARRCRAGHDRPGNRRARPFPFPSTSTPDAGEHRTARERRRTARARSGPTRRRPAARSAAP